jgi:DNA-directed RNA polymerase specialized sigma24 family protein
MAGRGRREIAAGAAVVAARAVIRRLRGRTRTGAEEAATAGPAEPPVPAPEAEPPAATDEDLTRLRGELADELGKRSRREETRG